MTSSLGDRMKLYERASDHHFTPNSPVVIRVDGKAFHTFLRHADQPFDERFMDAMRMTTAATATHMQGFKLAYTQSDEATFLVTDYDRHESQGWFDYSLNKIVSITASTFTGYFNRFYTLEDDARIVEQTIGFFDARAFVVPVSDVSNVFVWRQQDWERNSVQMLARAHFSHKQCQNRNLPTLHGMLSEKGVVWARDLNEVEKYGCYVTREYETIARKLTYEEIKELINPKEEE